MKHDMTNPKSTPTAARWLCEPLPSEVASSLKRLETAQDIQHIAVMPDIHLSGDVCNGTAVATVDLIYPSCVGGDIGCGMTAIAFHGEAEILNHPVAAERVLSLLCQRIPANKHSRTAVSGELPNTLKDLLLSNSRLEKRSRRDGLFQLGTLGRGNHFVEFQSDAEGRLWLMVHSGSRGMGQAITEEHVAGAPTSAGLPYLDAASSVGQAYLSDVNWAVRYAAENRLAMTRAVCKILFDLFAISADVSTFLDCHHNHIRRELHFGRELWVHRKGALPSDEGLPGVIPGSMGTRSYHVIGRGEASSLRSCSHGAGRSQARRLAIHSISRRDLEREMSGIYFDHRRADALRDEAPSAYKNISRVMRSQRELTRIVRELRPALVYKGT